MGTGRLEAFGDGVVAITIALYGGVLLMAAVADWILMNLMTHHEGRESALAKAMGRDLKGKATPVTLEAGS